MFYFIISSIDKYMHTYVCVYGCTVFIRKYYKYLSKLIKVVLWAWYPNVTELEKVTAHC